MINKIRTVFHLFIDLNLFYKGCKARARLAIYHILQSCNPQAARHDSLTSEDHID